MAQDEAVRNLATLLLEMSGESERVAALHSHLGEFCHTLRNRLNSLKLSLYLAKRTMTSVAVAEWAEIEREYQAMEQFLEQFQSICRPLRLTRMPVDLGLFLGEKVRRWQGLFEDRGRVLNWAGMDGPIEGCFDPSQIGLALDALVDWRSREGPPRSEARLVGHCDEGRLTIDWEEPGVAGQSTSGEGDRRSLALPLMARVLAAHGGSLQDRSHDHFRLRLDWSLGSPQEFEPMLANVHAGFKL